MRYVLGVDAGGSKTLAVAVDETGIVRGFGRAGPANHQTVGLRRAVAEIRKAAAEALRGTTVRPELGVFGLAGADLPEDFRILEKAVGKLGMAEEILIENDTIIALRAGASRPWGVVVVCGTGFNAAGIAPDGRRFRLPGLGWVSGDWGGGEDIAREVIRLVARAWDGRGQPTALTEMVLRALELPSVEELIRQLYRAQLGRPAKVSLGSLGGLVPLVFEAASRGDGVARGLLIRLGEEVGRAAGAVIRRLDLVHTDVEVVLAGGVFRGHSPLLLDTVAQTVHRIAPRATIVLPQFEPVVGAALLALEGLGVSVGEAVYANLNASLPRELKREGLDHKT